MTIDIQIPLKGQFLPPLAKVHKRRFMRAESQDSGTSSGAVSVWRPDHEESAEGCEAFYPNPNCGCQGQAKFEKSFGSKKDVPLCASKKNEHTSPEIYKSKKNQSVFLSVKKPTTHHHPQRSPQDFASMTSTKALHGCVLQPAKQKTQEHLMAFEPGMTFLGGKQKVKVVLPRRLPRKVTSHLTTSIQSPTAALFADKCRRTEYQVAFGPKLRTGKFNVVLFRQLRGIA